MKTLDNLFLLIIAIILFSGGVIVGTTFMDDSTRITITKYKLLDKDLKNLALLERFKKSCSQPTVKINTVDGVISVNWDSSTILRKYEFQRFLANYYNYLGAERKQSKKEIIKGINLENEFRTRLSERYIYKSFLTTRKKELNAFADSLFNVKKEER